MIQHKAGLRAAVTGLAALMIVGNPGAVDAKKGGKKNAPSVAEDMLVVDCLLPQKTRRLGRRATFLVPRKPIRTTAIDCRIRGGEHTAPDQANLMTALSVWRPQADAGDAEAQYFVGQIYERGLGAEPDPERAASWYRKAAEQDYRAAQVSLGYLYESGLGVDPDPAEALRWYRRAAGTEEDLVVLAEQDHAALLEARADLETMRAEADSLAQQVEALTEQVENLESETAEERARRNSLDQVLARTRDDLEARTRAVEEAAERIIALEAAARSARADTAPTAPAASRDPSVDPASLPFGRYRALVIGNSHYQQLPGTPTAEADARAIAELLESRYGFEVDLLIDATRFDIMSSLNQLRRELTEADHLLVYYAGHGVRDAVGENTYWQPVDADPESPANWIPNAVVTEHLDIIPARHALVVADSVYSGLRTRSSIARLPRGMTDEQRYFHVKRLLDRRSRLVLTSGTETPVAASSRAEHSRFSSRLLEVLRDNDSVLEASSLYFEVNRKLSESPETRIPVDFATLKWARNDLGEFFFVPKVVPKG